MGQRQTDVFVKRETTHLRNVNGLVLDDLGERLIGGQRAGTGRQTQHGVRLALIRSATQRAYISPASASFLTMMISGIGFLQFRAARPMRVAVPPPVLRIMATSLSRPGAARRSNHRSA